MNPLTTGLLGIVLAVISDVFFVLAIRRLNRLNIFTPLGFYFVTFLVTLQIPGLYLYFAAGWYELESAKIFPITLGIAPLFFGIGSVLFIRAHRHEWHAWWNQPLEVLPRDLKMGAILLIVMTVILCMQLALVGLGKIPLINMFRLAGQSGYLTRLREEAFKLQAWYIGYPIIWNIRVFAPLAAGVFCARYFSTRQGFWSFLGVSLLALFVALFHGARSPGAILAFTLYLIAFLIRGKRANLFRLAVLFLIIAVFAGTLQSLRFGYGFSFGGIITTFEGLANRLFYATPYTSVAAMRYVHEYAGGEFFLGRTIRIWCLLTGQQHVPLPFLVGQAYMTGIGEFGIANTSYFGDLYANFGFIGVMIGAVIAGAVLGLLERLVITTPKTFFSAAMLTIFAVQTVWLNTSALQVWLLSHGALLCIALMFWYRSWRLKAQSESPLVPGSLSSAGNAQPFRGSVNAPVRHTP